MTVSTTIPYTLTRLGVVMAPQPGEPLEAEGVLNPASGRDHIPGGDPTRQRVEYCAGAMILDPADPARVLARTPEPILVPETEEERSGVVPNVVFPTAIEEIDGAHHVFYGMADAKIGVARLDRTP